jgi:hypothetical protein
MRFSCLAALVAISTCVNAQDSTTNCHPSYDGGFDCSTKAVDHGRIPVLAQSRCCNHVMAVDQVRVAACPSPGFTRVYSSGSNPLDVSDGVAQ